MVENLLGGPAPTLLPEDTEPVLALASGQDPDLVARSIHQAPWRGQWSAISPGTMVASLSHTPSLASAITEALMPCVAMGGKVTDRCRGVTSPTVDSFGACLPLVAPRKRSTRLTRQSASQSSSMNAIRVFRASSSSSQLRAMRLS